MQELYDDPERADPPLNYSQEPLSGPKILKSKIRNALASMKNGKALGPDGVSTETLKALETVGIDLLQEVANAVYESGQLPPELNKSTFVTIPKKPGAVDCENFRTMALISHVTKMIIRIMISRLRHKSRLEISDEQCGFLPDRETRNAIFCYA